MSAQPSDTTNTNPTVGIDAQNYDRYASLATENDEIIVNDLERETAWIQSDSAVELREHR
ncbi:MAG: hypothetical protein ACI9EZ_001656 [Halobacteriales archaeon]|jgi:hypothetical protein